MKSISTRYLYIGGDEMRNDRLANARKEKKLTQEQLGLLLGYTGRQSVANWENGHCVPTLSTAIEIAKILDKDVEFLFGYEVQDSYTSSA
jgi:putative transcriptional regulator